MKPIINSPASPKRKNVNGLFIGITSVDIVYNSNEPLPNDNEKVIINDFEMRIGGPAAKAAMTCAELGGDATLITCIGDSAFAQSIKAQIEAANVKVYDLGIGKVENPNISCVYIREDEASRTIISGINHLEAGALDVQIIKGDYDYCLYDCNLINLTPEIVDALSDRDIPLVLDCGNWKKNIEPALKYADTAISSACFKSPAEEDIFALGQSYNIENVAMTRDGDSILYKTVDDEGEIPVEKIDNCNSSGAGDVFHGAFCYYYYHEKKSYVEALTKASIHATDYVRG